MSRCLLSAALLLFCLNFSSIAAADTLLIGAASYTITDLPQDCLAHGPLGIGCFSWIDHKTYTFNFDNYSPFATELVLQNAYVTGYWSAIPTVWNVNNIYGGSSSRSFNVDSPGSILPPSPSQFPTPQYLDFDLPSATLVYWDGRTFTPDQTHWRVGITGDILITGSFDQANPAPIPEPATLVLLLLGGLPLLRGKLRRGW